MKKIITLTLFCVFSVFKINAQCSSDGTSFGNNSSIPSYNVTGMVSVVLNSSNLITLNLGSNFATANGPDVRVFLVDKGSLTNAQLKITSNFLARPKIEMGLINGNGTASFTKTIPAGINISNLNTIYFYCQQFNAFWDFGSFVPFTNENCATLGNENFAFNSIKIYPNPSKGIVNINFYENTEVKSLTIYSALGQKVFVLNEAILANTPIDISSLSTGIYFLELIDSDNNTILKKISVEN